MKFENNKNHAFLQAEAYEIVGLLGLEPRTKAL